MPRGSPNGSDRLELLLESAERLTVDLISQRPVSIRLANDTPAFARHVAAAENFDILPIEEVDGRIVRYVQRSVLENHVSETEWDGVAFVDIHPDEIVSAASPLLDLLDRFSRDTPRLFVLGRRQLEGIATVYDLNQPAAHQFAFALATIIESELGRAIEQRAAREMAATFAKDGDLDVVADDWIRRQILELPARYGRAKQRAKAWRAKADAGEQVRLTRELVLYDKVGLVEQMGLANELAARCRQPYGASGAELLSHLSDVRELRNAIAHDRGELADEWSVWGWMRTTFHLAQDMARSADG
jgi:hypothetical protein